MSKKSLDELFQEKFRDFKETPDEKVWASIEASLNKKRKKRILPLWWQLGGVAAVLLIGLFIFNPFGEKTDPTDNGITDVDQKENVSPVDKEAVDPEKETIKTSNAIEVAGENTKSSISDTNDAIVETESNKKSTSPNNGRTETVNQKSGESKEYKIANAASDRQDFSKGNSGVKNDVSNNLHRENSELAALDNQKDTKNVAEPDEKSGNMEKDGINSKNTDALALNDKEEVILEGKEEADSKKSLFDELKNQEEEEIEVAEKTGKRWSAGPSIAPVYYDAMGKGSPVSPMFSSNSKSGNVNMSYGLSVAYEISPKLSVRSGVHKVNYGYDTNDVYFTSSISALSQNNEQGQIANIDYAETAENLVVSGNNATLNASSKSFDVSAKNVSKSGVMAQQLGYLEVPVELSYALVNNKFGLNVIGGVSSLFLVDNEVDLTSGDLTTQIGEANNANDLNFSANFGIGMGYQFSQKLRLNIEPVFKYQLNTFSNVDGTFNPYSIGVYSGLSFKF